MRYEKLKENKQSIIDNLSLTHTKAKTARTPTCIEVLRGKTRVRNLKSLLGFSPPDRFVVSHLHLPNKTEQEERQEV